MDRYTRDALPTKGERTQEQYRASLQLLRAVFGEMAPSDVSPIHIYAYLDQRQRVAGNRDKAVLSNVYTLAIRLGMASANPCKQVRCNPEPPRDRYVTSDEFNQVRTLANPVLQAAMDLAVLTGLRLGDLIGLRWADWKEDGLHVKTRKTGRYLLFARSKALVETLVSPTAHMDPFRDRLNGAILGSL